MGNLKNTLKFQTLILIQIPTNVMIMREGKDERSPSSVLTLRWRGGDSLQRAVPRGPAMGLRVSFRADAGKAIKRQVRNGDRTGKMLKHHREKEIHCSSHSFSSSDSKDMNLGDSSEAY